MKLYRNVMEDIVEDVFDDMLRYTKCCNCERCHADIIACALNMLPPKYAVTSMGASYSKVSQLGQQQHADIQKALAKAIMLVSRSPHHDTKTFQEAK